MKHNPLLDVRLKEEVVETKRLDNQIEKDAQERRFNTERAVTSVQQILRREHEKFFQKKANGGVFSFYVAGDIFYPETLRCIDAPGAYFPAAASHFLTPITEKLEDYNETDGIQHQFFSDVSQDRLREINSCVAQRLMDEDIRNRVFGDFVVREKILSRARFIYREEHSAKAILTVNFRENVSYRQWKNHFPHLLQFFKGLTEATPCFSDSLYCNLNRYYSCSRTIIQKIQRKKFEYWKEGRNEIKACLTDVLDGLVSLFQKTARAESRDALTYGTFFQLDDTKKLVLAARSPNLENLKREFVELDPEKGTGVISWVAVRGKAIRIEDFLAASNERFKEMLVPYTKKELRSQLAVPVCICNSAGAPSSLDSGSLLGILSIESTQPNLFDTDSLGFLRAIADEIALLIQVHRANMRILEQRAVLDGNTKQLDESDKSIVLLSLTPNSAGDEYMRKGLPDENRLSKLMEPGICSYFVPGATFWEIASQKFPADVLNKYRDEFAKRNTVAAPVHDIQSDLDRCMGNWVCGELTELTRSKIHGLMHDLGPVFSHQLDSPAFFIHSSARAADEICISFTQTERGSKGGRT